MMSEEKNKVQFINCSATADIMILVEKLLNRLACESPEDSFIKLDILKTKAGFYALNCSVTSHGGIFLGHSTNESIVFALEGIEISLRRQLREWKFKKY